MIIIILGTEVMIYIAKCVLIAVTESCIYTCLVMSGILSTKSPKNMTFSYTLPSTAWMDGDYKNIVFNSWYCMDTNTIIIIYYTYDLAFPVLLEMGDSVKSF